MTVVSLFGDEYVRRSYDFRVTNIQRHVEVCIVCEVVSRPWQRQEIPWDVFNKGPAAAARERANENLLKHTTELKQQTAYPRRTPQKKITVRTCV